MAARQKERFSVYARYYLDAEEPENCIRGEWSFMGTTYAVSEKQAVNNVRHRTVGCRSQYVPVAVSGHWENGFEWKAVKD